MKEETAEEMTMRKERLYLQYACFTDSFVLIKIESPLLLKSPAVFQQPLVKTTCPGMEYNSYYSLCV